MTADDWRDAYRLHERGWSDYEELYEAFEWQVPEQFNIAQETSERWRDDDRLALVATNESRREKRYTYAEIDRAANRLANAFVADGIEPGDRIAVTGRQLPAVPIGHLAAWKCGAVTVPVSPLLGTDGLAYRLRDAASTAAVVGDELLETLAELDSRPSTLETVYAADCEPDPDLAAACSLEARLDGTSETFDSVTTAPSDPASVFYTSGSTGDPKGVVLPHRTLLGVLPSFLTLKCDLDLSETDRLWTTSEWSWIALYTTVFTSWFYGVPVLAYDRGAFDADAVWAFLADYEVTSLSAPPAALRRLRDATSSRSVESVRVVFSGGSLLRESTVEWARRAFAPVSVHVSYGLTEAACIAGNCEALERPYRSGAIGVPQPGHEIRLLDPDAGDGDAVPSGEVGEIALRAASDPACMDRYWEKPEKTREALRDGWLHTNDLARRTSDDYLEYVGRADEVIISSGYRIGPREIEESLDTHDAVEAVAVIGILDPERGEIPKAVVVPADGYEPSEPLRESLQQHAKRRLALYEYPREIEFATELPTTSTGKIKRDALGDDISGSSSG
jgi:acetyl-CoA synthetase